MLLGIFSGVMGRQPLEQFVSMISKYGYEAIELAGRPGDKHVVPAEVLAGKAGEIRRLCAEHDLEITAVSTHLNHLDPDPARRAELNAHFEQVLEAAQQLGVHVVNTFSGAPPGTLTRPTRAMWDDFRETYLPLVDKAKEYRIRIGIEVHFGSMAFNVPTMRRMFQEIPDETLGLNYDPSHFIWQLEDYLAPLREFPDRVYHSHAKDIKVYPDLLRLYGVNDRRYYQQTIPGMGDADWSAMTRVLMERTPCEVWSVELEDHLFLPEDGVRKSAEFLKPYCIS